MPDRTECHRGSEILCDVTTPARDVVALAGGNSLRSAVTAPKLPFVSLYTLRLGLPSKRPPSSAACGDRIVWACVGSQTKDGRVFNDCSSISVLGPLVALFSDPSLNF